MGTQGGTSVTVWRKKRGIKHWTDPWLTSITTMRHCSRHEEPPSEAFHSHAGVSWGSGGFIRGSVQSWSADPFQLIEPAFTSVNPTRNIKSGSTTFHWLDTGYRSFSNGFQLLMSTIKCELLPQYLQGRYIEAKNYWQWLCSFHLTS